MPGVQSIWMPALPLESRLACTVPVVTPETVPRPILPQVPVPELVVVTEQPLATTAETWKLFEVSAVADVAPHPPAMTPASIVATMR